MVSFSSPILIPSWAHFHSTRPRLAQLAKTRVGPPSHAVGQELASVLLTNWFPGRILLHTANPGLVSSSGQISSSCFTSCVLFGLSISIFARSEPAVLVLLRFFCCCDSIHPPASVCSNLHARSSVHVLQYTGGQTHIVFSCWRVEHQGGCWCPFVLHSCDQFSLEGVSLSTISAGVRSSAALLQLDFWFGFRSRLQALKSTVKATQQGPTLSYSLLARVLLLVADFCQWCVRIVAGDSPVVLLSYRIESLDNSWSKSFSRGSFPNTPIRCLVKCLRGDKLFFESIFIVDLSCGLASTVQWFCYGF
jgi:hypothetical protein